MTRNLLTTLHRWYQSLLAFHAGAMQAYHTEDAAYRKANEGIPLSAI